MRGGVALARLHGLSTPYVSGHALLDPVNAQTRGALERELGVGVARAGGELDELGGLSVQHRELVFGCGAARERVPGQVSGSHQRRGAISSCIFCGP